MIQVIIFEEMLNVIKKNFFLKFNSVVDSFSNAILVIDERW